MNGDVIILNKNRICIFGSDKRMNYLSEYFKKAGYTTDFHQKIEKEKTYYAKYFILPIGTDPSTISSLIEKNIESYFFVGNSSLTGEKVFDYFKDEVVTIQNTIPTAEGTIATAIMETDSTLFGSKCLILGYGKVAKTLASYLGCFGAKVTVAARKERDRVLASINLFNSIDITNLEEFVGDFDIIFNTVPAKIIKSEVLQKVRDDCLIIDLASKPGGVDFKEAELLGKRVIWALGLPGKTAPKTASLYIFNYIYNIISKGEG